MAVAMENNADNKIVDEFDSTGSLKADRVVASLIQNGGCILRGLLPNEETLATIEHNVRPYIEADRPWQGVDFFPPETRRVTGLVGKSSTFTENIPANKFCRDVC
jgi:hypothetical protein